jgi:VCBS repeat-containing protein
MTINGVNDAPVAVDDAGSTDEDDIFTSNIDLLDVKASATNILANDTDVDVEDLDIAEVRVGATVITDDGANGDSVSGDGTIDFVTAKGALVSLDVGNGEFTYDPNDQFESLDSGETAIDGFQYKATDSTADSGLATVTMTINGVNDAPVAEDDSYTYVNNSGSVLNGSSVLFKLDVGETLDDSDPDDGIGTEVLVTEFTFAGQTKAVGNTITNAVTGVTLTVNADGTFEYDAPDGFFGAETFDYTIADDDGETDSATVTINVQGVPSLADRFFINEIVLNPDGADTNTSKVELFNNFNNSVQAEELATASLELVNPDGELIIIGLDQMIGLTVDEFGNPISGGAIPGNSFLVVSEPDANGVGIWEVYSGNTVKSGIYYDTQWSLGDDVTESLAVNLLQAGSSLDLFVANDAQLSDLTFVEDPYNVDDPSSQTFLTGVGALGEAPHFLGDTSKKGFDLPERDYFPWYGGAQSPDDQSSISPELAALIDDLNSQFNGSLGDSSDNVFARVYDRYLTSSKGSSVDSVFTDANDAGDWTYGNMGIETLGDKNTVYDGNKADFVENSGDPDDDINPLQGTGHHGNVIAAIPNEDGQTVLIVDGLGRGGAGADFLYGLDNSDQLMGDGHNDFLWGGGGNDMLDGGSGNDVLDGGADNDVLVDGTGLDMMTGGTGADTFKLTEGDDSLDLVTDFSGYNGSLGEGDKIDLTNFGSGAVVSFAADILTVNGEQVAEIHGDFDLATDLLLA